jgi:hypothetical protein
MKEAGSTVGSGGAICCSHHTIQCNLPRLHSAGRAASSHPATAGGQGPCPSCSTCRSLENRGEGGSGARGTEKRRKGKGGKGKKGESKRGLWRARRM